MVDFFDRLYASVNNNSNLLKKIKYYSFLRFSIRACANIIIPLYFNITKGKKAYSLGDCAHTDSLIIVSLTSFPARINRAWLVIESLMRQDRKPDKIILWLSIQQFPTMDSVPESLIDMVKRGLTIRLCKDDLRSHKKYYYAIQEFPNDYILTVDDDVFYHSKLLSFLIDQNKKYPHSICCNCALRIGVKDKMIIPYLAWKEIKIGAEPSLQILAVGVGGILYPPNTLNKEVINSAVFKKYCFLADDIWLNIMARLNHIKVTKTGYWSNYLPVINLKNTTLHSKNMEEGLNDVQINMLREYYQAALGIDPFQNILNN